MRKTLFIYAFTFLTILDSSIHAVAPRKYRNLGQCHESNLHSFQTQQPQKTYDVDNLANDLESINITPKKTQRYQHNYEPQTPVNSPMTGENKENTFLNSPSRHKKRRFIERNKKNCTNGIQKRRNRKGKPYLRIVAGKALHLKTLLNDHKKLICKAPGTPPPDPTTPGPSHEIFDQAPQESKMTMVDETDKFPVPQFPVPHGANEPHNNGGEYIKSFQMNTPGPDGDLLTTTLFPCGQGGKQNVREYKNKNFLLRMAQK